MMVRKHGCASVLLVAALLLPGGSEGAAEAPGTLRVVQAVRVRSAPDMAFPTKGPSEAVMRGFVDGGTGKPAAVQTRALLTYDADRLYVLVEC